MDWNGVFLEPLRNFFSSIMLYLPLILGALVLLLVGWIAAKVLRNVARRLVRASGIDKRLGRGGEVTDKSQWPVAEGTGTAVYWIVWIFFTLAILQVLGLQGVLSSINVLFQEIFAAIPNIIAAVAVLTILYFVGRFTASLVTRVLTQARFNEVPVNLGLAKQPMEGTGSPANLVGYVVLVFIMLFGVIMAADLLGFPEVNQLVTNLTSFLALVIFGLVIIGVGMFVANLVANSMKSAGRSNTTVTLVRVLIMVLAVAVGLRSMGFANDIILLMVGLAMGAIAVAAAIAFGLGGRQVAGRMLEQWMISNGSKGRRIGEMYVDKRQTSTRPPSERTEEPLKK
ncbi:MAG: mechanosensitive ion channel [Dehalococcoidales bacterium]|nr:mechanosensitive ion channel [Dehalococcoidales bacterium]